MQKAAVELAEYSVAWHNCVRLSSADNRMSAVESLQQPVIDLVGNICC